MYERPDDKQWYVRNYRLQAENEKHRWIPVRERLPKSPTQYLVCDMRLDSTELPFVGIATRWSQAKGFYLESGEQIQVTHWKPIILPEQALKGGE